MGQDNRARADTLLLSKNAATQALSQVCASAKYDVIPEATVGHMARPTVGGDNTSTEKNARIYRAHLLGPFRSLA